jgi:thiol-disulfide isomerase/thioredoxin
LVTISLLQISSAIADDKNLDRTKRFEELKADYDKARKSYLQALNSADTPEKRQAAWALWPSKDEFLPRILTFVEQSPKDDMSCDVLCSAFVITHGGNDRVVELLTEHHAANRQMWISSELVGGGAPETSALVPRLLSKVLDQNPSRENRACACFSLGAMALARANGGEERAVAEAELYFERVTKEYSELPLGSRTMGIKAKRALFELRNLRIGKAPPDFEGEDLNAAKVRLSDYRGKVVVLDFWATWCVPCREMIPHERELVARLKEKPFVLVSISVDDKKETLAKFLKREPMPWVHWWEGKKTMADQWNITHYPTIHILDAKGILRFKDVTDKNLDKLIDKLISDTEN